VFSVAVQDALPPTRRIGALGQDQPAFSEGLRVGDMAPGTLANIFRQAQLKEEA